MAIVYLSLGSNIGMRDQYLAKARDLIDALPECSVVQCSYVYETTPVGGPEQDNFLNQVVKVTTTYTPDVLLTELLRVEIELGRVRTEFLGPRTIDIDIVFYNSLIIDTEVLRIPHPLLHERLFVLGPLAEIVPDYVHPVLQKTVQELKDELFEKVSGEQVIMRYM